RLNNGFRYEATMSLLYSLARALDRFSPAPVAYAHCDIPCGIYDPHHAQMAAHTVVRMIDLINQLEKPGPNATPEQRQEYNAKLLKATNDIASIYWKTKGLETMTVKAPYPTERQTVYPKFR